ncbi:MAG: cyclopropane fatty acyl phospholipid synthase [Minisyncoccia bacterium]
MLQSLLDSQDIGVSLDGNNSWDPRIRNERFYERVLREGRLGAAESYMDGRWECSNLPELFYRLLSSGFDQKLYELPALRFLESLRRFGMGLWNRQTKERSLAVGEVHYDDRVFQTAALGDRMVASCAYYDRGASTLDEAQDHKMALICEKLYLEDGHRLLDIGCGWGTLMHYAESTRALRAIGLTISRDQQEYARKRYPEKNLEFLLEDYRDFKASAGSFERVVSVGMLEHVGKKNYPTYFNRVRHFLAEDGLFLLHSIVGRQRENGTDPFIDKYIFPNGELPTMAEILESVEGTFVVEDLHNLGTNYEWTLRAWRENLQLRWSDIVAAHGMRTARMYEYYLAISEAAFRSRTLNVVQIVLSPRGKRGGYRSIR